MTNKLTISALMKNMAIHSFLTIMGFGPFSPKMATVHSGCQNLIYSWQLLFSFKFLQVSVSEFRINKRTSEDYRFIKINLYFSKMEILNNLL